MVIAAVGAWIGCAGDADAGGDRVIASAHPIRADVIDAAPAPDDRGLVLTGRAARALLADLELDGDGARLVALDQAPTHEVRVRVGEHVATYEASADPAATKSTASPEQRELAERLARVLARAPTHHGHWVQVPVGVPVDEALAMAEGAGFPAFGQPIRRRSPWVRARWARWVADPAEAGAVEDALAARRDAFTARLVASVPGATAYQSTSGSARSPDGPTEVAVTERYQLPFGADLRAVAALIEADGAEIEEGHDPTHYLVAVWTRDPAPPTLPAPLEVVGRYFPFDE